MTMEPDPTGALEDSLDDWLGAPVPTTSEPVPGAHDAETGQEETVYEERVLPVPDEDRADRLLARARRLDREQERVDELAKRRKAEIDAWRSDLTAGVEQERGRIRTSLDLFMRQWHRANPKRKSIPLPNGRLQLRAPSAPRIDVTDEYAFIKWAEENGRKDLLRYKPEPNKMALAAEEGRHARPDDTIVNDRGEPELYATWSIMTEVLSDGATGEQETVSIPGVRVVQRRHDRFDYKLTEDQAKKETEQ
jgi:phage host-nuclease inhibitor protein Gam